MAKVMQEMEEMGYEPGLIQGQNPNSGVPMPPSQKQTESPWEGP